NYAPDSVAAGKPARADFVGWSGLAPISYFIEYAIGVKVNAQKNIINWEIKSPERVGIEKFWFAENTVNLICEKPDSKGKRKLFISSNNPIIINVKYKGKSKKFKIPAN